MTTAPRITIRHVGNVCNLTKDPTDGILIGYHDDLDSADLAYRLLALTSSDVYVLSADGEVLQAAYWPQRIFKIGEFTPR